jgi:hypothetical protein
VLSSSVLADYHLGVFFAPLLIYYIDHYNKSVANIDYFEFLVINVGSVLMLAPKNYIFYHGISLQVALNPLIILLLTIIIIYYYEFYKKKIISTVL